MSKLPQPPKPQQKKPAPTKKKAVIKPAVKKAVPKKSAVKKVTTKKNTSKKLGQYKVQKVRIRYSPFCSNCNVNCVLVARQMTKNVNAGLNIFRHLNNVTTDAQQTSPGIQSTSLVFLL